MDLTPGLLAQGPWSGDQISARWSDDEFAPSDAHTAAADAAVAALAERGSPSHDGLSARLAGYALSDDGGLAMELQPARWSLRLVDGDANASMAAMCAVRDAQGRWLAGRRAPWVASWAGRWALGAGGAVDLGESPFETLSRELAEDWSVTADRVQGNALIMLQHRLAMFIGQAWLPDGAEVTPDHEHDAFAWWPSDPAAWPDEADEPLRRMAAMLSAHSA